VRSVLLTAARAIAQVLFGAQVLTDHEKAIAAREAMAHAFKGRNRPKRDSDAALDPYFGIKTKGRRGNHRALQMQALAFAQTAVAKRNARAALNPLGRSTGRMFKSDARHAAFRQALAGGLSHNQALKEARRVAA
jgi:hypothetical protein